VGWNNNTPVNGEWRCTVELGENSSGSTEKVVGGPARWRARPEARSAEVSGSNCMEHGTAWLRHGVVTVVT
jgi:hypothetical protein